MERNKLIEQLEEEKYQNLYFIFGREAYLIEEVQELFKKIVNTDMADFNLSVLDGKETNIEQLISSVETLPFMAEKRVLIIKDFELFKGKRKNFSEEDEKILVSLIENIPETTILVFISYGEVDKKRKIYKVVEKNGIICEMKKMEDISLLNWCKEEFISQNIQITNSVVTYFIEMTGYRDRNSDMTLSDMKNEIRKLSSYIGSNGILDKNVVDELLKSKSENDIFQLIDLIGNKNSARSVKVLNDMLDNGESVLGVFAMLSKQFSQIIQVKTLQEKKMPQNIIKDTLHLHPYAMNKLMRQSRNFSDEILIDIINYIMESDFKIKQGKMDDRIAAEIFIAKYCR